VEKIENPMKKTAMALVHMMDHKKRLAEMDEYQRELFMEEYNNFLMQEIVLKGYSFDYLMLLGLEYRQLTLSEYMEWRYQ
jgi:hypothetical protein